MGRRWLAAGFAVLLGGGSGCGFEGVNPNDPQPNEPTRVSKVGGALVISRDDPNYSKFEAPEEEGECAQETDCSSAGCSAEVCTTNKAAYDMYTQCVEVHPGRAFYCTCLESRCQWQQDPEYVD